MFDNATSYAVYIKNALQIGIMNKNFGSEQLFLYPDWYIRTNGEIIIQQMYYLRSDPQTSKVSSIQKSIQIVLIE